MQPADQANTPEISKNSETRSVFGGSLSIRGTGPEKLYENDPARQSIYQKKMKKRLQLKQLILTKFKNKYCMDVDLDESVNVFIQEEIDRLFTFDHFDERDLVAVDQKVRDHIKAQAQTKKKDSEKEPLDQPQTTKQATLTQARLLDAGGERKL
jgi:hypothetical protein